MESDGLATARKMRQEIASNDDIQNAFDAITYDKGAAVISMFEVWVGEEKFRKGIRRYLEAHAHKNATSRDFLEAISAEAGPEVAPAFSSFLDQAGVPLVKADLACEQGKTPKLALSQERFLPAGSAGTATQSWRLPVCVRYGAEGAPGKACMLLTERAADLPLTGASTCPDWVLVNQGGAGYYRVAYGADALDGLLGEGRKGRKGRKLLTVPERLAVIRDAGALAQAGKLPIADVLSLVPDLVKDPSPHVLRSAAELAFEVRIPFLSEELRPAYARFIQKTFGKKGREIGLRPKAGEDDETRLLRPLILHLAADRGEDKALVAEAQKLAARWLDDPGSLEPDVIDLVLGLAARHGDRKLFDRIHAEAKKATDQKRRLRLLGAMASFRDPAIVTESLSIAVSDEFDARDALRLFFQDPRMSDVAFGFLKQRFDAVVARVPGELQGDLPRLGESFCDAAHRADVEAFFKDRIGKLTGGSRTLAQTLEEISLCSALREKVQESLTAFLKKQ
jgi:alanyl aminopeptidase